MPVAEAYRWTWPARAMTRALGLIALLLLAGDADAQAASHLDRFAIAHLGSLQSASFRNNAEYCGLYGIDASGKLVATPAQRGAEASCDPGHALESMRVVASYHTHGSYSPRFDNEVPSVDDLVGDFHDGIDGYVSTPGGRVWVIRVEERTTAQLCGPGCVRVDPGSVECAAHPPKAKYTLRMLRQRARQDDADC